MKSALLAGFGAVFAAVAAIAIIGHLSTRAFVETSAWVAHTHAVLEEIDGILSSMKDVETGMRGFLLTGQEDFLEPYLDARRRAPDRLRRLRDLTRDNARQQRRLDVLEPAVAERLSDGERKIGLRREQGLEAAVADVQRRSGKKLMDGLRALAAEMTEEEQSLLRARTAETQALGRRTTLTFALMAGLVLPLLLGMFTLLFLQISRRQGAEETLRAGEEKLQAILDNANAIITLKDRDGRYLLVNRRFETLFRVDRKEVRGKTSHDLFTKEAADAFRVNDLKVLEAAAPLTIEEEVPHPDGNHTYVSVRFPLRDAAGAPQAVCAIATDITDVKRAEKVLDRFFTASLELMVVASLDGYFKRVSPSWAKCLGWELADLVSRPWMDFVHPDDRAVTLAEAEKLAQGVAVLEFENRYRCRDGSYRWLSWRVPAPEPGSTVLYCVARDVTELRRKQEEIRRLNAELEEKILEATRANRELEAFSYSVSHDLRAPLRHAGGFVDLLEKHAGAALDEKGRRYLTTIGQASRKMGRLIDDLLAFSRMGRVELRREPVPLEELVREVRGDLAADAQGRDIDWQVGALPLVLGDRSLLRQVFANLLSNALKYTRHQTRPRIEIGAAPVNGEGPVCFVRDNGAGFDMRYKDKLFGVFQRLHRVEEFEGTGIGLANVKRIVERHGGRVWAEGTVGQGAAFYFTLPTAERKT